MPKPDPSARTALYRLLAANGRLLYVGIAANPDSRWGGHSTQQPWWADVADRKVEWFPDRAAAAAAEVAAIKQERPLHNIQHAVADKPGFTFTPRLDDLDSEKRLLGSMLRSKRAIWVAAYILEPTDFYRPAHEIIFWAIAALDTDGEPADATAVVAELTGRGEIDRVGGAAYIHELPNLVQSSSNAGHYASIVRTLAVTRRWATEEQAKGKR